MKKKSADSCDERILRDCFQMYTDPERGLMAIAESVDVTLLPPKKITVMLIGNHSAGKSSFINWYIKEQVQKTKGPGQGFTIVASGCKRETLKSKATFELYPHFRALQEVKGVSKYISTEISTSREKRFSLVTFVDTPGLVDGDMQYPFDVDQAILKLGDMCDLILVFLDPVGQALCKRTLDIVGQLNERQGDRLRFYLSKADEAGGESDRQRVMMQIVQELCKRPGLNKSSLDMTTIYIPKTNKPTQCINQIDQVCHTIQKTINLTVQNTLNTLEKDCELIREAVTETLNNDWQYCKENRSAGSVSCALGMLGFFVMVLFALMMGIIYWEILEMVLGTYGTEILLLYLAPLIRVLDTVPVQIQLITSGFLMQLSVTLIILAFIFLNTKPTLSEKQKIQLQKKLEYVQEVVKAKKKKLHQEYLQWSVSDQNTD
ncbi:uncharacterized protein Hap1MRO34_018886 isoform 1-T1 [Clarias gariepinus]|uniref:uncharacterized protein LOC128544983 isoform X1 n=1 Tax=Clarias gariepinus TaxID=13013 RepID=UPI00234D75DE|nr:uncharacterized protein LOC128544983 isoform X1 [Clarias gariepinus]